MHFPCLTNKTRLHEARAMRIDANPVSADVELSIIIPANKPSEINLELFLAAVEVKVIR